MRGYSSVGRALAWHARGQRFDPAYLHQIQKTQSFRIGSFFVVCYSGFRGTDRRNAGFLSVGRCCSRGFRLPWNNAWAASAHPTDMPVARICFCVGYKKPFCCLRFQYRTCVGVGWALAAHASLIGRQPETRGQRLSAMQICLLRFQAACVRRNRTWLWRGRRWRASAPARRCGCILTKKP